MKLQYIGHSQLMTVLLPIGAKRNSKTGELHLTPGKEFELDDKDGKKLLDLNCVKSTGPNGEKLVRYVNFLPIEEKTTKPAKPTKAEKAETE